MRYDLTDYNTTYHLKGEIQKQYVSLPFSSYCHDLFSPVELVWWKLSGQKQSNSCYCWPTFLSSVGFFSAAQGLEITWENRKKSLFKKKKSIFRSADSQSNYLAAELTDVLAEFQMKWNWNEIIVCGFVESSTEGNLPYFKMHASYRRSHNKDKNWRRLKTACMSLFIVVFYWYFTAGSFNHDWQQIDKCVPFYTFCGVHRWGIC